jgi:hypothetical protein
MMNLTLATICAALFTVSICHAQTSIEDPMNRLKTAVLNGDLSTLTVACPAGYQSMPAHVQLACAMTLRILINDLQQKGEFGRTICPTYSGNSFEPLFEATPTTYLKKTCPIRSEPRRSPGSPWRSGSRAQAIDLLGRNGIHHGLR